MKKSVYISIVVILILIIIVFCVLIIKEKNNSKNTNANVNFESNLILTNETTNIIQANTENGLNETETEVENTIKNEAQNTQISTETFEESPKTQEEKAIEIVKNDWKDTQNVKYGVEGMDENGRYIVTVRNSQTTKALAFYTVDVSNKSFEKKEMN